MQNNDRIVQLLYRRLKGLPLNGEENQELDAWLARSESNRKIFESLSDEDWLKEAKKRYYAPGKEAGLAQLREQLFPETPVIKPFRWARRIAAAASILIILATAIYLLVPTKQATSLSVAALNNQIEITPGGEAILTLSNGSNIPYRKQANGLLAQLSNGKQVYKQDGKLVYQYAAAQSTAGGVDTTTYPRRDQYSVMLSDGSLVWLNRGSTLSYPEEFTGDARKVELVGEAYFEIAKVNTANGQGRMPFIVKLPTQPNSNEPCEVEVLGTHFNIYAHKGEAFKTTLTEGKVNVKKGQVNQLLDPGQQAVIDTLFKHIEVKKDIYVDGVLAWKNNQFDLREVPVRTILAELERWYGTSFVVMGNFTKSYSLISDRNKPLSEVLDMLKVRFTEEGDKIVVKP